jgi:WD40 repeat protein
MAQLWDVNTGQLRSTLTHPDELVRSVAFSPDRQSLATVTDDFSVRLWDVALPDPGGAVNKICQSVRRDFTDEERETYLPGESDDPVCPL